MSYSLKNFGSLFWVDVRAALIEMLDDEWNEMCQEVFDCDPDFIDIEDVITKIEETDTCDNLDEPVEVWIDTHGYFTIWV